MMAFRIQYLVGVVRVADIATGNDKSAPEWPPHPSRLFSALVASWGAAGEPPTGREALEWLERQPPPALQTSESRPRDPVVSYVPANDDVTWPRRHNARRFPTTVPDSDIVYMIWPDASPPADVRRSLERLAALTPALGHSSSLVDVRLCDEAPPPTLIPDDNGPIRLRVPGPGRLARLHALHETGLRPDAGRWQMYASPSVRPPMAPAPGGVFGDMFAFQLGRGVAPIPLVGTLRLCAAMRGAVLAHADQPPPEVISGHAPGGPGEPSRPTRRPHVAFVPLADVGHGHARGHVMGIGAILPREPTPGERRQCLRALSRVEEVWMGPLGRFALDRQGADVERQALTIRTWTRPSTVWASVTPVVFGRFPDEPFGPQAEQMVADACVQAGYTRPEKVDLGSISWIQGAPASHDYPARPEAPGRPRRFHVHVRLTFREPVAGPVVVGAGRYYGYGFCRPVEDAP